MGATAEWESNDIYHHRMCKCFAGVLSRFAGFRRRHGGTGWRHTHRRRGINLFRLEKTCFGLESTLSGLDKPFPVVEKVHSTSEKVNSRLKKLNSDSQTVISTRI